MKQIFIIFIICVSVLSAWLCYPLISDAAGPVHGARAAGMGTAFLAVADDPSSIIYNPAGLIRSKGTNIYGGITPLIISSTYKSNSGAKEETEFQVFYPPHLYLSSDLGMKDTVLGVGLYSPFGIGGRKWSKEGLTRYISTRSEIGTYSINPTLARQVSQALSVGAGIDYMKAVSKAESMIDQSAVGAGDGEVSLDGDGSGWGYNVGALYQIDRVSIAAAYRSGIKVDIRGTATLEKIAPAVQPLFAGAASFDTGVSTTLDFPDIWSLGVAFSPTGRLTLALDYELVRWSVADQMTLDFDNEVPAAGFVDRTTRLDWKDSSQIKAGAEYHLNDRLSLRGGYAYVGTFVPDHTLDPGNPDSDQHNFAFGFGYRKNRTVIDAFYNIGFFEKRSVNNAILTGDYENLIHYAGMSAGYNF